MAIVDFDDLSESPLQSPHKENKVPKKEELKRPANLGKYPLHKLVFRKDKKLYDYIGNKLYSIEEIN
jgi:hypothetical protein